MNRLIHLGFICFFGFKVFDFSVRAEENSSNVFKLMKIPKFNERGHLDWEIHASKVSPQGDDFYQTTNPILYLYNNQVLETTAQSNFGDFSLRLGQAHGNSVLKVSGNGFYVTGKDWIWTSTTEMGENQMVFKKRGKIRFNQGLGNFFAMDTREDYKSCEAEIDAEQKESNNKNLKPTVAEADYLEFLSIEENSHRFLLNGNVSVDGKNLFLTCDKMEVLFNKDENTSSAPIGKISSIYATGDIVLKQNGRTSYSDNMTLDLKAGTALLRGNARVVDDEWGEAVGETIILEKGKRMAKVLGGKNVRPKLELPPLPDLGFSTNPKKIKSK